MRRGVLVTAAGHGRATPSAPAVPEICNLDVTSVEGQVPLAVTVTFP